MKKALVALSLAALFAGSASAEGGQVTFNGELIEQTCTVVAADKNKTVNLAKLWVSEFDAGNTAKTPFSLTLEGCPVFAGKVATIKFQPNDNSVENGILKNNAPESNVGFKVLKGTSNVLVEYSEEDVLGHLGFADLTEPKAKEVFDYTVEYAKTNEEATVSGPVVATLPFVVEYK